MFTLTGGDGLKYGKVEDPYALVEKENEFMVRIGEKETIEENYEEINNLYEELGLGTLVIVNVPNDQKVVDKVFQNTGYVSRLL